MSEELTHNKLSANEEMKRYVENELKKAFGGNLNDMRKSIGVYIIEISERFLTQYWELTAEKAKSKNLATCLAAVDAAAFDEIKKECNDLKALVEK